MTKKQIYPFVVKPARSPKDKGNKPSKLVNPKDYPAQPPKPKSTLKDK